MLCCSYPAQNQAVVAVYKKLNSADNNFIYLNKNGTFLTQFFGGCDGKIETPGKWKINKDTLNFAGIEIRMKILNIGSTYALALMTKQSHLRKVKNKANKMSSQSDL